MTIDPFMPEAQAVQPSENRSSVLSLFKLNSMVRAMLSHTMPGTYWLAAEVGEMRVASNGHCYMEFVQKDDRGGTIVARARANVWAGNYVALSAHFERETGQPLAAGMKVLVEVSVTFHELYGYSLNVSDIDPSYTLGDWAKRRSDIIRQLEEDGVMTLNKELDLPRIPSRIAVVSSATAAGYGDFCNQLQQSGFRFTVRLFQATMQGDRVEESVISALDRIAAEADDWDVVVMIRGGGAATDLYGFDSYLLSANVAQFPLPVLTGIGHERDDTVVDLVAHTRLKTPTAVAAFLIDRRSGEQAVVADLQQRLATALRRQLSREQLRADNLAGRFRVAAAQAVAGRRLRFDDLAHRFELAASRYAGQRREQLLRVSARLDVHVQSLLRQAENRLSVYPRRLSLAVERLLVQEHRRLELLERSLRLAGPERILSLGFSITLKGGKAVRDASTLEDGDELTTQFAKGTVKSTVKK